MGDRRGVAGVLAGIVVLGLAGCGNVKPGNAVIRVGAVYPTSGNQAEGAEELHGVQLAADLVNRDGGVRGARVQVVPADVPTADAAPKAVDRLVDSGIDVLVGTYGSTQSLTASQRASERGATFLESGAVADAVTGRGLPGILRTVATGSTLGRNAARWAHDFVLPGLGLAPATARVVVMFEGDQYGAAVGYGAIDEANAQGLNVVDTIKYDAAHTDFNKLAAQVDSDHPDAILTASYLEDAIAFRRAAIARHLKVKAIIGTSSAYCRQDFGDTLGKDAVGLYASDKPDEELNVSGLSPAARALYTLATGQYRSRYRKAMSAAAISGFVAGWVLFHEVLSRAASTSRSDVWSAAMALDLPEGSEINGAGVRFAAEGQADAGQNRRAASVIWEWVGIGHRAVVYPPAYAQAKAQVLPIVN